MYAINYCLQQIYIFTYNKSIYTQLKNLSSAMSLPQQSVSILQAVLLKNPILKLFNSLISNIPLFSDLSNHFGSIFLKSISTNWQKLLLLAGATAITTTSIFYLRKLYIYLSIYIKHTTNQALVSAKVLKQKYGDCWVAITGFTQGIGWAFVNQLLSLNMKVILIGRNKEKIDKRVNFLKQKFPNSAIEVIIGDLSKATEIKQICKQLKSFSQTHDIGILINNAGLSGIGELMKNTPQSILDISETNWTSVLLLNSTLIPIMKQRKQRSAIINISSSTGKFISPILSTYPASKRMINVYSEYLRRENGDKIDVMTVMPFGVTTPMMRMTKNYATITPQVCAKSIIGDLLGGHLVTYGGLPHKFFGKIFEGLSEQQGAKRFQTFWRKHI